MKTIIKLWIFLMVFSGLTTSAQTIQMRIAGQTATVGDVITVPVYVDNSLTGLGVMAYQLQLQFNSNILSVNSVSATGTMSNSWGAPAYYSLSAGYLNIAGAGGTALSGTGVLVNVSFTCIGSGGTLVSFYGGTTNNYFNEGTPVMTFVNGSMNINPLPSINVSPNSAVLAIGETQQFTVSGGTAPYTWSVTNPVVAAVNSSGLITANAVGLTKVQAQDNNGIIDQTNDFVEVRAMSLSMPSVSAYKGGTVEVPITTTSLTGHGIVSGEIRITFNANILTPSGLNTSGTLLQAYSNIFINTAVPGEITIAFAGTTPLSGSGTLIKIGFNVSAVNTGNSGINFIHATFNETLPAKTVNGYFTMLTYNTISISPNTHTMVAGETKQFTASGGIAPYSWSSSDVTVASVNSTGLLTAHKSGIIQLTAIDNIGANGTSGNITVYDTYVTIANATATLGTQYDLAVTMTGLPVGQQVYSVQGTINFKSPELSALDIITTGTMTNGWSFATNITAGSITFAGAGAVPFSSAGLIFKVRFQLNPSLTGGEFAFVNFGSFMLNENIPLPLLTNGGITGSTGYQVNVKVFLEGPYNTTAHNMNTNLFGFGYIPLNQPYNPSLPYYGNASPVWLYSGTEAVAGIPANVVDWVLVQLRDASTPQNATSATIKEQKAGFLLNNGNIVGLNGTDPLLFSASITQNLYVVVFHRNHLGVISANALVLSGGAYSYDFSTGASQALGGLNGHKLLETGVWGMISSDGNGNGLIQNTDETAVWKVDLGQSGYKGGDFNMNGLVQNTDETNYWKINLGAGGQTPAKGNTSGYQSQVPE